MKLRPATFLCALPGIVVLDITIWNGLGSDTFGWVRICICIGAFFAIWLGVRMSQSPLTLPGIQRAVFKINCAFLAAIVCLVAIEGIAFIVFKTATEASTELDQSVIRSRRSSILSSASRTACQHFSWSSEHLRNVKRLRRGLFYKPYSLWGSAPFQSSTINIDDEWDGVRRTINKETKDTVRKVEIFMFGGSTLFCSESTDKRTIASELAAELQTRKPNHSFRVTNFGASAFLSDQELVRLTQVLTEGGSPDLVLFYDGVNDKINKVARGQPHFQYQRFKSVEFPNNRGPIRLSEFLIQYDYVHRLAASMHKKEKDYGFCQDTKELQMRALQMAQRYRQNSEFAARLGAAYGFLTVHFWQPDILNTGKVLTSEEQAILGYLRAVQLKPAYTIADKAIMEEMKGVKTFYNVSSALDQVEESVFFDFCHVSAIANGAIAKALVDKLLEGEYLQDLK